VNARRRALLVVDLGFGDAGKGTVVDYLARRGNVRWVVRFNGGAQAGHNVVAPDGRHHTFAQFGAASFVPGVRTFLSKHMVVHPTALLVEARHLREVGVSNVLERILVSRDALCITPFQQAANRLRELARGSSRHGTCGVGVGETVSDALADPAAAVRMSDLADANSLRSKLHRVQERKRAELVDLVKSLRTNTDAARELEMLEEPSVIDGWIEACAPLREAGLVLPPQAMKSLLREDGDVVFEGAQGVLLDEWRGFHPHTTWSTCTFDNAIELLREHSFDGRVVKLGVLRSYTTRHGQGPMPTEVPELLASLPEPHNNAAGWQGVFRVGWADWVLSRYAIAACGGVDGLALTHLDRIGAASSWRVCDRYRFDSAVDEHLFLASKHEKTIATDLRLGNFRDLEFQEALTRALASARPEYQTIQPSQEQFVSLAEQVLGARVWLTSNGPGANEKRLLPAAQL
jgi:adenylosuccinate synthase